MRDNQVLTPVLDELGVQHVFRANPRQNNLGPCCMFLWKKTWIFRVFLNVPDTAYSSRAWWSAF